MSIPDVKTAAELLPCPFCGPGQSMVDPWYDDVSKRWAVGCGRCGSSSGRSIHAEGSKEAAIKSWNTRAPAQCDVQSASEPSTREVLDDLADKVSAKIVQLEHYKEHDCQLDHARIIAEGRISQANQILHWIAETAVQFTSPLPSANRGGE